MEGAREIKLAESAGFCFGVQRAVEAAENAIESSKSVYCLGELIHNPLFMEELADKGLIVVESPEDVPAGGRMLIRAHGVTPDVYREAEERGIEIIDATCPFVHKIHEIARDAALDGRIVVIVGDGLHPEVIGICGHAGDSRYVAGSEEEARDLAEKLSLQPVTIVAQTTINKEYFERCADIFKEVCSDIRVENTVCRATRVRQEEAEELASLSEAMVVIGGKNSSNSKKLYEICKNRCENVFFIEKLSDLPLKELQKYNKIGITASASAPERIIKEVISTMSEEFTKEQQVEGDSMLDFMEEIEKSLRLPSRGEVITGEAVHVTDEYVVINLGCKKDGMLPKSEIALEDGQTLSQLFQEGDEVQAKVIKTDDGDGNILLSKKRLQSAENWDEISQALENKELITVTVTREVKGGIIAAYKEISGFIPMSQIADHYVESAAEYVGKTLPVRVTRVDQRRNKAIFSHKAVLLEEKQKRIAEIWDTLNVGDVVEGKVMRFTDYGAFVDIGGLDGLLHISEISWGKLRHPQEALEISEIINVKILAMNEEKGKISLGLKQTQPEPWSVIDEKYAEGQTIEGKVVQIKEYGAFVELSPGLDGLVHISELAHKRVNRVADELEVGQIVNAKILEIDKERRRISLSIKDTIDPSTVEEEPKAEETPETVAEEKVATELLVVAEDVKTEEPTVAAEEAEAEKPLKAVAEEPAAEELEEEIEKVEKAGESEPEAVAEESAEEPAEEEAVSEETAEAAAEEPAAEEPAAEAEKVEKAEESEPEAVAEESAEEPAEEEAVSEETVEAAAEEPAAEELAEEAEKVEKAEEVEPEALAEESAEEPKEEAEAEEVSEIEEKKAE